MRQKAAVVEIGTSRPHAPDGHGCTWTVENWVMEGGDFHGLDASAGTVGGWTFAELAMLASVARNCGNDAALDVAAACGAAPPERRQITFTHSGMGVCNKGRVHVPPCDFGNGL